ncbi:HAD hydrolase-like protein [candidate division WOR-3 bacterium]|nr:HAD hydrolase-like protein [candidate division WOR-3 bacterium]
MSSNKLAVFDMDGTLYRSETSFMPAVKSLLKENGLAVPEDEFLFRFIGEPDSVFIRWLKMLNAEKPAHILYREFQGAELGAVERDGQLYEGVIPLLGWLKEQDFNLAVCSNATEIYLNTVLEKFNLLTMFSALRVPKGSENKTMMLREIKNKFSPGIGFMIGDRSHDMTAANENYLVFIGALYGFGRKEIEGAEYSVEKPMQIRALIEDFTQAEDI